MNETTQANAIFAPIWRRKWLILAVALAAGLGTYVYYKRESPVYSATTQLYAPGSEGEAPAKKHKKKKKAAEGVSSGQASLVNSPLTHVATVQTLRAQGGADATAASLGTVSAKAGENSAFTKITAEANTPHAAALLADTTAQVFVARQTASYQAGIRAQIAATRVQLKAVEQEALQPGSAAGAGKIKGKGRKSTLGVGKTTAALEEVTLSNRITALEAALPAIPISQFGAAKPASAKLLRPKPRENALFAFVIALVLASCAAVFLSRFDRRLQSLMAIEAAFEAPILAALPAVRHPIVRREGRLYASEQLSDPLRRLHTSIELSGMSRDEADPDSNGALDADGEPAHRSILFLSPDAADGKSTIIAALAMVQRESGEDVAVVEADFRRPVQARLLDVPVAHGLAEVLSGALTVDEAIQPADAAAPSAPGALSAQRAPVSTMTHAYDLGRLSVLVGRLGVANPPALLARRSMAELLHSLADDFDYTLVDVPPPLQVSDAMPLLPVVDGIVLVARVGHTREIAARRLAEILARTPSAPVLGAVANHASRSDLERYGFYSPSNARNWLERLTRR